jgi:hypothetical protein
MYNLFEKNVFLYALHLLETLLYYQSCINGPIFLDSLATTKLIGPGLFLGGVGIYIQGEEPPTSTLTFF